MEKSKSRLTSLSHSFQSIVKDLGMDSAVKLHKIKIKWNEIFPPPLSLHMQPSFFKDNTLHINVDNSAWLQELFYQRKEIINKLRPYNVRSVKLKLGRVDIEHKDDYKVSASELTLSMEDELFVNSIKATITDPELRERIGKAMKQSLLRKKADEKSQLIKLSRHSEYQNSNFADPR